MTTKVTCLLLLLGAFLVLASEDAHAGVAVPKEDEKSESQRELDRKKDFLQKLIDRMTLNVHVLTAFQVAPRFSYRRFVVDTPGDASSKRVFFTRSPIRTQEIVEYSVLVGLGLDFISTPAGKRSEFFFGMDLPVGLTLGSSSTGSQGSGRVNANFAFGFGLHFLFSVNGGASDDENQYQRIEAVKKHLQALKHEIRSAWMDALQSCAPEVAELRTRYRDSRALVAKLKKEKADQNAINTALANMKKLKMELDQKEIEILSRSAKISELEYQLKENDGKLRVLEAIANPSEPQKKETASLKKIIEQINADISVLKNGKQLETTALGKHRLAISIYMKMIEQSSAELGTLDQVKADFDALRKDLDGDLTLSLIASTSQAIDAFEASLSKPKKIAVRRIHVGLSIGVIIDAFGQQPDLQSRSLISTASSPRLYPAETVLEMERCTRVMPYFSLVIGF